MTEIDNRDAAECQFGPLKGMSFGPIVMILIWYASGSG